MEVTIERHKVLQILVNLMRNAKEALDQHGGGTKTITLQAASVPGGRFCISVTDNGVGIDAETMGRLFQHGFTTRKEGHGFGLHSGALSAREMGGTLTVESEGKGRGATFKLELPIVPPQPEE